MNEAIFLAVPVRWCVLPDNLWIRRTDQDREQDAHLIIGKFPTLESCE
jgi:hypothetical protein